MTPEEFVFWMDGLLEGRVTISEECLKMIRAANREALDHIKLSRAPSLSPTPKDGCGGSAEPGSTPQIYGWTRPKDWEGPKTTNRLEPRDLSDQYRSKG